MSSGEISKLFDEQIGCLMMGTVIFCQTVLTFQEACLDPKQADSEKDPADQRLHRGLTLRVDLERVNERFGLAKQGPKSRFEFVSGTSIKCPEAFLRLTTCLDAKGLAWIKKRVEPGKDFDVNEFLREAKTVIHAPTTLLDSCINTCSLSMDLKDLEQMKIASNFGDLIGIMPHYAKVSSINRSLMNDISAEKLGACEAFQHQVEEKLTEHVDYFSGISEQLERLNNKYKSLGVKAHKIG